MARSITQHTTERARKGKKSDAARCKPKTCPRCGGQEGIERPRFFCGQLLTDKDLDAAQRYVVEYIEECFGTQKPDCDGPVRARRARCDEGPKEYCLVLSYAEELSQKATALVRDKGCQESRCEFSRVRETFR